MNQETNQQIFSSTGRLGVSRRPFGRLYVNGTRFSDNPGEVERNYSRLIGIGERHAERIGRVLFRGLVSNDIMQQINDTHRQDIEVALPVSEFSHDDSWLVYASHNRPDRQRIVSQNGMIQATEDYTTDFHAPLERIRNVINRGYSFVDQFNEQQIAQVLNLWGETFGWSRDEVAAMHMRLSVNIILPLSERNVWFSGIADQNGNIVSAAMAEQLSIPGRNGQQLHLVESTEWRTDVSHAGQGLMTANLAMLNAQILHDFREQGEMPLIYAECNFQSRSDRSGHGAGFVIPPRSENGYPAPQILVQNVSVHDGQPVDEGKLRDFTFMYMPVKVIDSAYSQENVRQMMRALPRR